LQATDNRRVIILNRTIVVQIALLGMVIVPVCTLFAATPGIVVDAHNDTVQNLVVEGADFGARSLHGGIDLPRLREGGVTVPFFAANVPIYYPEAEAVRRTLDFRDAMQRVFDNYPNDIELATSARQIEKLVARGKIAAVLTVEGGHQIGDDLAVLRTFRRLGFLSMTLTHFKANHWADSATSPPVHNGLTDFGRQVVREMNRIGMIVDVSHTSDKTFYDTLAVSSKPVIASHSSCRALVDFPRNMDDKMLRALAANGGVVGINFYSAYVNAEDAEGARKLIKSVNAIDTGLAGPALDAYAVKQRIESGEANPIVGNASIADVVACIAHAVDIAGIDHVGIGADFDGIPSVPSGLEDISKMPALRKALHDRGYSDSDIRKIMGENFLRVIREVVGE
jgi:membrane dipeptidase